MKKWAIGLVAVIGAGVAAAPFVSGMMIEQRFKAYQLPAGVPAGTEWHLDAYQRGYAHSTALSTLSFASPELKEPIRVQIKQEIDQVPSLTGRLATVRTTWVPSAQVKAELRKLLGDKPPVVLNTAMMLSGATHTTGTLAAFSVPTVQFSGGTLSLDTSKNGHFDFSMAADSLKATDTETPGDNAQPVMMSGLKMGASGVLSPEGVAWDSQFHLGIDSLSSGANGHVGGITLTGKSAQVGSGVNTALGFDIKNVDVPDLPPAAKGMRHIKLHYRIDGLDTKALTAIVQQVRAAQNAHSDPEQIKQAASMALMAHLPALLNNGVTVQVNPLGFDTDAGKVAFNLSINLPAGQGQQLLKNPTAVISVLTIKGDYSAPQALMNAALSESGKQSETEQINQLIQQGYIKADQGVLSTHFLFEKGQLSINGKPANGLLGAVGALGR